MIKKILCAVDFSETSRDVALYSSFLASKLGLEVYVLHVVRSLMWTEEFGTSMEFKESYEEDLYQLAMEKMKRFIKSCFSSNVKVFHEILKGDVVKQIINYAEKKKVDLIVIGAHGEHGIHEFIFGSVTEKVIKLSKIPVFVVKRRRMD